MNKKKYTEEDLQKALKEQYEKIESERQREYANRYVEERFTDMRRTTDELFSKYYNVSDRLDRIEGILLGKSKKTGKTVLNEKIGE